MRDKTCHSTHILQVLITVPSRKVTVPQIVESKNLILFPTDVDQPIYYLKNTFVSDTGVLLE